MWYAKSCLGNQTGKATMREKKYNAVDVLRGSEALSCAMHEIRKTGKLFSEEDNLFEKSEYAKKEGWDKKRPQVLGFNNYVNFFVGGEYNSEKLLKDLKYRLRISSLMICSVVLSAMVTGESSALLITSKSF